MTTEARSTPDESESTTDYLVQYETTKSIGTTEMKEMTDMSDIKTTGKNLETGNKVVINENTKYSPISYYVITCLGKINVNI